MSQTELRTRHAGTAVRLGPAGRPSAVTLAVLTLLAGATALPAQGQTSPQAAAAPGAGAPEQVIVTATRREQRLSTVPMAVTALDNESLEAAAVRDTQDLTRLAPGLVITTAVSEATASTIRLRGIGTSGGTNLGLEGSVGVFLDGVYLSRPGIALADLNDIAQVEVLRGPQGTLFGKNTSAGALVLRSTEASFVTKGRASVALGNRNSARVSAAVGGPLVDDKLAYRVSAVFTRRDGYLDDVATGAKVNDRDRVSLRGQLRAEPTEAVSLRLIADYSRKNESCCAATAVVNGPRSAILAGMGGFVATEPNGYHVANSSILVADTEEHGVSAHAEVRAAALTWNTIVSYRNFRSQRSTDSDLTNVDLINNPDEDTRERFLTAETTLRGVVGRLDWLAGAYYFRQKTDQQSSIVFGRDLALYFQRVFPAQAALLRTLYPVGGGDTSRAFAQSASGWSVFTHNIITLAPGLKAALGARYLEETKNGSGRFTFNSPACGRAGVPAGAQQLCPTPDFDNAYKDEAVVGTAVLSYEPTRDSVLYASFSRGYKAGGLNLDRTAGIGSGVVATFLPEEVDSVELGARATLPGGAAQIGITAFSSKTINFQQNAFTGTAFAISNAAEVNSDGAELEASWRPARWLSLNTSLVYNKATYGPATADPLVVGRQIVNAPKWTWQNQAQLETGVGSGGVRAFVNVNMRQVSSVNTSVALVPQAEQKGYTLWGGRVGLRGPGGKWEVAAFAQNLTNEYYRTIVFAGTLQPGTFQAYVGEPRSFGVEARLRF